MEFYVLEVSYLNIFFGRALRATGSVLRTRRYAPGYVRRFESIPTRPQAYLGPVLSRSKLSRGTHYMHPL